MTTTTARTVYETETPVPCEWFALCANLTTTGMEVPRLGIRTICTRCATRVGIDLATGQDLPASTPKGG